MIILTIKTTFRDINKQTIDHECLIWLWEKQKGTLLKKFLNLAVEQIFSCFCMSGDKYESIKWIDEWTFTKD